MASTLEIQPIPVTKPNNTALPGCGLGPIKIANKQLIIKAAINDTLITFFGSAFCKSNGVNPDVSNQDISNNQGEYHSPQSKNEEHEATKIAPKLRCAKSIVMSLKNTFDPSNLN